MRIDRRSFVRGLAGSLGLLAGGPARAGEPNAVREVHRATRNTLFGPVGRGLWSSSKSARRSKVYLDRPTIRLPAPRAERQRPLAEVLESFDHQEGAPAAGLVSLVGLARLLYFTNGVTGRAGGRAGTFGLRAAPSAGALYAGEIYVAAERVVGLAPGLYYYDPTRRLLLLLQPGSVVGRVEGALARPSSIAAAAILLTNVFGRYGSRYANRGYRYALIDTGHIGENLRLSARSAGLSEWSTARFEDDLLNELVELDGREEAVCAIHLVGLRAAEMQRAAASPLRRLSERGPIAPPAARSAQATERFHLATGLVAAAAASGSDHRVQPSGVQAGALPMLEEVEARTSRRRGAPASHSRASVEDCILRRRSARGFADRPLSRETLEWIIEAAAGGRTTRATDVSLLLAVHRVSGLAAGRYGVREGRGLVAERPGDLRGPLVRACLGQRKAGTCAVAFFIVGDIERARSMRGDRSYRDLLIESGAIAQRIYLAAEAAGLAARNLAAFRDDAVNRLLELDGDVRPALHLTLVGYEDPRASKAP